MTADPGTLTSDLYGRIAEVLPHRPVEAGGGELAERDLSAEPGLSLPDGFDRSLELIVAELRWLAGEEAAGLAHGELEERMLVDGREIQRLMLQDHLDLRAVQERRAEQVVDSGGVRHGNLEAGHERPLVTVFGEVRVGRIAYRARGQQNLYPADAVLNLPAEKHSHGLRRLAAVESARGSFEDALAALERATGQPLAKRQLEQLAQTSAVDFESFYAAQQPPAATAEPGDALVLSCDGKGIVMRNDALRPATQKQAASSTSKLKTRLSKGEKRNRKRMAEVGAVYETTPVARSVADVLPANDAERAAAVAAPAAKNKWVTASVTQDAQAVVAQIFDEAERRDPDHQRAWVALVDGNNHQINRIKTEAKTRELPITIVLDFVHVLEYLWKAAWCFYAEGDPAAELWVRCHAQQILAGHATRVAGAIRRAATNAGLDPDKRAGADSCADYLTRKVRYLDYPTALRKGWPIATGVIEGACRHLVRDRMDITGARWGLDGAEAILKLRALNTNGDFDHYWSYHLTKEHRRVHQSRYANNPVLCPA